MSVEEIGHNYFEQARKINWEASQFPEEPWERTGLLLNSAINLGPKSTLLMLLPGEGEYLPIEDMGRSFRQAVGGSETFYDKLPPSVVAQFCRESLEDIGMVARAVGVTHSTEQVIAGYGLTPAGEKYGVRAAALALDFEYNHEDISIYEIFGQTSGPSKTDARAPMLRAQLMMKLYASNSRWAPMKEVQKLTDDSSVWLPLTLESLVRSGVVERDMARRPVRTAYSQGERPLTDVTPVLHRVRLTEEIVRILPQLLEGDRAVTTELLSSRLIALFPERNHVGDFRGEISKVMNELTLAKYLQKNLDRPANKEVSYRLTPKGGVAVTQFINPLFMVMQDNPEFTVAVDSQVVSEVRAHLPMYAKEAVRRYYPLSRAAKIEHMKELDTAITTRVGSAGTNGISIRELMELTGDKRQTIINRLNRKIKSGNILRIDTEFGPRYITK